MDSSNNTNSLVIMDCGCSQAGFTVYSVQHLLKQLPTKTKVHLILCDTNENDWKIAFKNANDLAFKSAQEIVFSGIGRSFFNRLVPEQQLDLMLVWSMGINQNLAGVRHWVKAECTHTMVLCAVLGGCGGRRGDKRQIHSRRKHFDNLLV